MSLRKGVDYLRTGPPRVEVETTGPTLVLVDSFRSSEEVRGRGR